MNKVELRGNVGSVRLQKVGDRQVVRFTLATNYAYKDKNGGAQIETTWHTVVAWQGKGTESLDKIEKGSKVSVLGRIRCEKYQGTDEQEHTAYEVVARKIDIIGDGEALTYEF